MKVTIEITDEHAKTTLHRDGKPPLVQTWVQTETGGKALEKGDWFQKLGIMGKDHKWKNASMEGFHETRELADKLETEIPSFLELIEAIKQYNECY